MAAIKRKPTAKPAYVSAPTRANADTRTFKVTWKAPGSGATSADNEARVQGFDAWWDIHCVLKSNPKRTATYRFRQRVPDPSRTEATLNLNSWKSLEMPSTVFVRDNFYPGGSGHDGAWAIRGMTVSITYYNSMGRGPSTYVSCNLLKPYMSTVTTPVQSESSGHVSCKVTSPKGDTYHETHSTMWRRTVYDSSNKSTSKTTGTIARGASATISWDVADRMRLRGGQYVRFMVEAWTRGFWGDSDHVSRTLYISYPAAPTITSVSVPSKAPTGRVTVGINLHNKDPRPVTGVRLQMLRSTTAATAAAATASSDWEDLPVVDDGQCSALSCHVSEVSPTVDTHTWLRVKSWNQHESVFSAYSAPKRLTALETKTPPEPTAANDGATIISATAGKDRESVKVHIGIKENNLNTGTIIAWADHSDAHRSTSQPETYEFTWLDSTTATGWTRSTTVTVRELEAGTKYWFWARRYRVSNEGSTTTYSPWSKAVTCTTVADPNAATDDEDESTLPPYPTNVQLRGPAYIARGAALPLSWTFDIGGDNEEDAHQTAWQLLHKGKVLASGTDARGAYTIPAEMVAARLGTATSMALAVTVQVGGMQATSAAVTFRVADAPRLALVGGSVTAQPMSVTMASNSTSSRVSMVLRSAGAAGAMPYGDGVQPAGDVVWSDVIAPAWTAGSVAETNLVTNLPDGWEAVANSWTVGGESVEGVESWLRLGSMVPVTPGTTYAISVTSGYSVSVYGYTDEDQPIDGETATFADSGTWTPTDATQARIAVGSPDHPDTYPDAIGDDVKVQVEVGSAATAWVPHATDLDTYVATVDLPAGLDLWDGATYVLTATATDPTSGLSSDDVSAEYVVAWSRQAPEPDGATVTTFDTTSDGVRTISATIVMAAPSSAQAGDLMDLYRVTPDGPRLVAADVAPGETVVDGFAPYGEGQTAYRVAYRTTDGDVAWADYPYQLAAKELRIDWGTTYVELPYNLGMTDSYSKDFEARDHLDGSVAGYWNPAVTRKATLSTALVRIVDEGKAALVRDLAQHAGPALVRTPDGCCYEADVQVTSIPRSYDSAVLAVALDATEVALQSDHMATVQGTSELGGE